MKIEQLRNGKRSQKGTRVEQMVGGVGKAKKGNSWKMSSEEVGEMENSNIQGELSITTRAGRMAEKCWRKLSRNQLMGDKELMFEKSRQSNFKQKSCAKGFHIFQPSPIWSCCCHQLCSFLFQVQVIYCSLSRASATIFKTWFDLVFEILVFTNSTDIIIHCKHKTQKRKLVYLEFLGTRNSEMLVVLCDSVWFTVSSCNFITEISHFISLNGF